MDPVIVGIIGLIGLIILLFLGMNVGLCMLTVGIIGFATIIDFPAAIGILKTTPYNVTANFNLAVIPLFILMGQFCFYSGISSDLYDTCYKWLSRVKGGLSVATLGACCLFSAICGSSPATAATMGTVCLPEMEKYGYEKTLSTGCLGAGGTLGILIPPSVAFVLYGISTGNSIGALFAAGIVPGILLTIFYIITVFIICKVNPNAGPKGEKFSWSDKFKSLKGVVSIVLLFAVVVGGIFAGLFTANEGAAIGAIGGFLFMLFRRKITWKSLWVVIYSTIKTSAMIFLIIIGAHVFGYFLTITNLPMAIGNFVAALHVPAIAVIIIILLIFIVAGCFLDTIAMLLLLVPIFYPIIIKLGFDPIWFGVLMVMVMEAGQITPPVGINVFIIAGIDRATPMQTIFKGVLPFLMALLAATAVMLIFPQLVVWLPNLIY